MRWDAMRCDANAERVCGDENQRNAIMRCQIVGQYLEKSAQHRTVGKIRVETSLLASRPSVRSAAERRRRRAAFRVTERTNANASDCVCNVCVLLCLCVCITTHSDFGPAGSWNSCSLTMMVVDSTFGHQFGVSVCVCVCWLVSK